MTDHVFNKLIQLLEQRDMVILAGAGISAASPACVPLFRPLRNAILEALIESLETHLPTDVAAKCSRLFAPEQFVSGIEPQPEVFFEALHTAINDDLFPLLDVLLTTEAPNAVHLFLADLLDRHIRLLVTTNFECSLEDAAGRRQKNVLICADGASIEHSARAVVMSSGGEQAPLWKIHGTLADGQRSTIRVTLNHIAAEAIDHQKFDSLYNVVRSSAILVIGYSGYDSDVSKVLIRAGAAGTTELFWLSRVTPGPTEPCHAILRAWEERGHLLIGDVGAVLGRIAPYLGLAISERATTPCEPVIARRVALLRQAIDHITPERRALALAAAAAYVSEYPLSLSLISATEKLATDTLTLVIATVLRVNILKDYGDSQRASTIATIFKKVEQNVGMKPSAGTAFAHFYAALAELHADQLSAAEEQLSHLTRNDSADDPRFLAQVVLEQGILSIKAGRLPQAIAYFDEVDRLLQKTPDAVLEMKVQYERAIAFVEQRAIPKALALFKSVLDQARKIGYRELELDALLELGLICGKYLGDHDLAAIHLSEALQVAQPMRNLDATLRCLFGLADLEYERGLKRGSRACFEIASTRFLECIDNSWGLESTELVGLAHLRYARCQLLLGQRKAAKRALQRMKPLLHGRDLPGVKAELRRVRFMLFFATMLGPLWPEPPNE